MNRIIIKCKKKDLSPEEVVLTNSVRGIGLRVVNTPAQGIGNSDGRI